MFKKVISMVLCVCICMPLACFAEEAADVSGGVMSLSVEKAIETALENNDQLAVCDYQKESYEYGLKAARITRKNNENTPVYASSGYELGYVREGYYIDMYETNIKLADYNKEKVKANITYNTISAYYNYKILEDLAEIAKVTLEEARVNNEKMVKLNELGMTSNVEMQNAQLTLDLAYNDYYSALRRAETAKDTLKITMNTDDTSDFILTSEIVIPDFAAEVDKDIESAMTTRCDVLTLTENLRLAESHCKLTERLATKNTAAYYSDLSTYMQTKYNAENSIKMIKVGIKESYNSVVTANENLVTAQQNVNIRKTLYDAAKLRFDMGMITNIDLTEALTDYSTAEQGCEQAKLAYLLAVEKYNYDITIGL